MGFCLKLVIVSTYGDIHYCGLNGIELYDFLGEPIIRKKLYDFKFAAEPHSVNILKGCERDIRTPDKLFNLNNDTYDDSNMWLAPYINPKSE